jgi:hypothetical protein
VTASVGSISSSKQEAPKAEEKVETQKVIDLIPVENPN